MTIKYSSAEAAIKALLSCNAGEMFEKIRGNQHSMEKHFSKQSAYEAAGQTGYPQGYFKRVANITIKSSDDLSRSNVFDKTVRAALLKVGAKKKAEFGKKLRGREIVVPQKSMAAKDDILGLVQQVIGSEHCELRENNTDPNTRFLAVSPIPDGFYGRAIDAGNVKSRDCTMAVVVINATSTTNPQIVTIFPASDQYVNGRPLLV
ncbi:hypothetical protein [Shinella sp.]|uniref:hypothetical protein n=1 Tax=Shinella sp. TaxID=1870904 RepID=UPI0029A760FA|nr:hypothetical protein [Shinella sp.]MDX3977888.1 hypothetical protein [Shinella sp.]